jgi:hypothetical protein
MNGTDRSIPRAAVAYDPRIDIRPAELADVETVLDLLSEAAAWTATRGFANWPARFPSELATSGVTGGTLFVGEQEDPPPSVLFGRGDNCCRLGRTNAVVGAIAIGWAARQVSAAGRACLRLDVSADNLPLCSYYEHLGFAYRGDRDGELTEPDRGVRRWKSRLYERACDEEQRT